MRGVRLPRWLSGPNQVAVAAGAVTTVATTAGLFVLPEFVPLARLESLTSMAFFEHPLKQLRVVAGVIGGAVAGYLATDRHGHHGWRSAVGAGVRATAVGVGLLYLFQVATILVFRAAGIAANAGPGVVLDVLLVPLFLLLAVGPVLVFGGFLGGALGHGLWRAVRGPLAGLGPG